MFEFINDLLFAQSIGFVALLIGVLAFQMKDQRLMFVTSEISNCFWIVHYILLGAFTGAFVLAIAVVRTSIVLFLNDKYKLPAIIVGQPHFLFCFMTPEEYWYKYMPFVASLIFSCAVYFNDKFLLSRFAAFVASFFWLIFGVMVLSIPEIMESSFIMLSILIGVFRHKYKFAKT